MDERRRYFRIEDTIAVLYEPLGDEQAKARQRRSTVAILVPTTAGNREATAAPNRQVKSPEP